MKHLILCIFALISFGSNGNSQTIRSLAYNTNGQVVAATNIVWTNAFSFSSNAVAAQVRTNLALGWPALTNTNSTNFLSQIGLVTNGVLNVQNFRGQYLESAHVFVGNGSNGLEFEDVGSIRYASALDIIEPIDSEAIISFVGGTDPVVLREANWNHDSVRASLGFSTNLASLWTATSVGNAKSVLQINYFSELYVTNSTNTVAIGPAGISGNNGTLNLTTRKLVTGTNDIFSWTTNIITFHASVDFDNPGQARTNLGVKLSAFTNATEASFLTDIFPHTQAPAGFFVATNPARFFQIQAVVPIFTTNGGNVTTTYETNNYYLPLYLNN